MMEFIPWRRSTPSTGAMINRVICQQNLHLRDTTKIEIYKHQKLDDKIEITCNGNNKIWLPMNKWLASAKDIEGKV